MITHDTRLQLFESHKALAVSIATKHWVFKHNDGDDVVQEALIALWNATDSYDETRASFSTHATYCISQALTTFAHNMQFGKCARGKSFYKAVNIVNNANKTNTPIDEILKDENVSDAVARYVNILMVHNKPNISLSDTIVRGDWVHESTIADFIPADTNVEEEVYEKIYTAELLDLFNNVFIPACLNSKFQGIERRKRLMKYYKQYIFDGDISQRAIANKIGISSSAVSSQFHRWNRYLAKLLKERVML